MDRERPRDNPFLEQSHAQKDTLFALMDNLHSHPERSFEEYETTKLLKRELAALDLALVDTGMPTGAAVFLQGGRPGKTVALRADIDAIEGDETADVPVRSAVPGLMHACGHDFHATCLYGAARLLAANRAALPGNVVFLFQPGEEQTTGAAKMLENGLLERLPARPGAMFGLHAANAPLGAVALASGPVAAAKRNFKITLLGTAGHAGFPHLYNDAIVAGGALVAALQTVTSRGIDPFQPVVCAVCSVQAGNLGYAVTDRFTLTGTLRALNAATLAQAAERAEALARHTAEAYRCTCEIEWTLDLPAVVNDAALGRIARQAAALVAGEENILPAKPMLGSDDFSVFGLHMPVYYYFLGIRPPGRESCALHHSDFCVDYGAIPVGSALLAQTALLALEQL